MEIDNEVELPSANFFDQPKYFGNGSPLFTVAKGNSVDRDDVVCDGSEFDQSLGRTARQNGYVRRIKPFSDRLQRGKAENDVSQLTEMNNEDVLENRLCQADILQQPQVGAGHLLRCFKAKQAEYSRRDVGKASIFAEAL